MRVVKDGVWAVSALADAPLWSVELGFDPSNARFASVGEDRWWMATKGDGAYPNILYSQGAKSWSWRRDRNTDLHAVDVAGSQAVAVGDNGAILLSSDYGLTWTALPSRTTQTLRDVCLSSDGTFGLAVGDRGTVLRADKGLRHWTNPKYNLEFDITSCAIAEQKDRFQVYFAGKGGAIYTSGRGMERLELIPSPSFEDIYDMTALETGEVLAVGGEYQDPARICEKGFLIEADRDPKSYWLTILIAALLGLFWLFTLRKLVIGWKARNEEDEITNNEITNNE